MNLHYAQVIEVAASGGMLEGKVRVGGAIKRISLDLLPHVRKGDEVLLCDGTAISRVENINLEDQNHVPGNSR